MEGTGIAEIVLDDMRPGDLGEVAEIERASCPMPWSESLFFNEIKNPRSLARVVRKGGRIAGYLCASLILDEGHILNLAVRPDMRRAGIASALIGDVIGRLHREGCRFLYLEVRQSNKEAREIYEKFGFKTIGTRKEYYVSPVEDAVIMVLRMGEDGPPLPGN